MSGDYRDVLSGTAAWSAQAGDCVELMRTMPDGCVDLIMCSPPYVSARTYGRDDIARTAEEWAAWMLTVCREARRVCKGLCAFVVEGKTSRFRYDCAPYLLVADLCREGFAMRKPPAFVRHGIPGYGGDWLRNLYETVVCFTRGGRLPWAEPNACGSPPRYGPGGPPSHRRKDGTRVSGRKYRPPAVANPGNLIRCSVGGQREGREFSSRNEAPYPEELAMFFVKSFCPPGGTVLDPFVGSGSTLAAARKCGRRGVGFDLRPCQVELTNERMSRLTQGSLFGEVQA